MPMLHDIIKIFCRLGHISSQEKRLQTGMQRFMLYALGIKECSLQW